MNKRLVYNSRQIEALDFERRQTMKRLKADSSKKFEALKSADENKAELRPEVEALVEQTTNINQTQESIAEDSDDDSEDDQTDLFYEQRYDDMERATIHRRMSTKVEVEGTGVNGSLNESLVSSTEEKSRRLIKNDIEQVYDYHKNLKMMDKDTY